LPKLDVDLPRRSRRIAGALAVIALTAAGCQRPSSRRLDPASIWVSAEAKVRSDTVGEGRFASQASFVLVDAENRADEPALITLGGSWKDERGATLGALRAESLWIPAGGRRMFALVDKERVLRPAARGAEILVYGAVVATRPPVMRVEGERSFDDYGKLVVQATLFNDANRAGSAVVLAAFYDAQHVPMARRFTVVPIEGTSSLPLQLAGPPGSRYGTIYLGDLVY
jgi:hypothetical protein